MLKYTFFFFQKNVENYVLECYDCLALYLCIQLINRYRWMCHKRAIAALDRYVTYYNSLYIIMSSCIKLLYFYIIFSVIGIHCKVLYGQD